MIQGIGHLGIVVTDIHKSVEALVKALDIAMPPIRDVPEKKMKVAVVDLKGIALEFIEDYSADGEFAMLVRKRGDGIHHFCLLTDDIEKDIATLRARGVEMADQKPRIGLRGKRIAFTKPSALNGIPIELSEP
jgi:methylmalonyl-CoA epimerase